MPHPRRSRLIRCRTSLLWSSQVDEGKGEKDGLIEAGTLSQGALLGDSVEGSEVEPCVCVCVFACVFGRYVVL